MFFWNNEQKREGILKNIVQNMLIPTVIDKTPS
jgi:hypothetical protein